MSVLPPFALERPATLDEALAATSDVAVPYAGGTELLLAMKAGLLRPETLVDVKRIDSLTAIDSGGDQISIGGAVTHHRAMHDPGIRERLPVLAEVLAHVGNPRVRASGTLGGNLCFAEPKSDVASLLIALGGSVELMSQRQARIVTVEEFIIGPYTTIREDDEILMRISVPLDRTKTVYQKFQTMERPTVGVAGSIGPNGDVRVVIGAVGGMPHLVRARTATEIDSEQIAHEVEVIPDMTGSDRYKRHITRLYIDRVMSALEAM